MKPSPRFVRDILFWVLMALAIGTFILDTQVRRIPDESYAHAAVFFNFRREMEWGSSSARSCTSCRPPASRRHQLGGLGGCRAVVSHLLVVALPP